MSSTEKLRSALNDGLLSFPITDFDSASHFDPVSYRERLEWFTSHEISAVFVAGGTGEFFSLSLDEYRQIIDIAVEVVDGGIPVLASAGRSIPDATAYCQVAEQAGIDGILLMPPYLTECPQSGLLEYARRIVDATNLQTIYYNRANGVLSAESVAQLAAQCDNLIGVKDGTGNMQALNGIIKTLGDRLVYIGGAPTAEIIAEAYQAIGVNTYSSAVFNFVPELAVKFYRCMQQGDQKTVDRIIRQFFIPFVNLRDQQQGYAVSLVKAGCDLIGRPGGAVRPPLPVPTAGHCGKLDHLIQVAGQLCES